MVSDTQKRTIQAAVKIFETGRPEGDYGKVTLLDGDPGHLTYGSAQTTLGSGNLHLLIKSYCDQSGAMLAAQLNPFLDRLAAVDFSLDHDRGFRLLLRDAGDDPVMHDVQDEFFDRVYWVPALRSAAAVGVETALGTGVVYDSRIHGSWSRMRDRTSERHGKPSDIGEQKWVSHYVDVRRDWLANHSIKILNKTVYRMDSFKALIAAKKWDLALPITVRGFVIDQATLDGGPAVRASAEVAENRVLRLRRPLMRGEDVRALQGALNGVGADLDVDGVFGEDTAVAVRAFQQEHRLTVDGIVGSSTAAQLGLDD